MATWMKWIIALLVVVLAVGGVWWWRVRSQHVDVVFRTATVKRGDLTATIPATGTIQPENTVDIGAQVQGRILKFGTDADGKPVDFRSRVDEDMLLAVIDDALYQTEVATAKAQLAQAVAGVEKATADVQLSKAKLTQAEQDWGRAQKLGPSEALAANSYDAYKSSYEAAVAQVAVSQASVTQAKATVDQANASLDKANRNLSYCTIKSPVKGEVISRRVNIGQTVVASLNAPSLFLIAKDLKQVTVLVPVNEADVGQIKPGLVVTFSVDAFPGRSFEGKVRKVRLEPTITQNVVTYPVEISTENPDETLLPYLTANVKFQTNQRKGVLSVPNAALRYTPAAENMVVDARDKYGAAAAPATLPPNPTLADSPMSQPATGPTSRPAGKPRGGAARNRGVGVIWIAAGNNLLKPIDVKTGMTDGASTELLGDDVAEGAEIVIGEAPREAEASAGTNPFAPQMPGRRTGGGGGGR